MPRMINNRGRGSYRGQQSQPHIKCPRGQVWDGTECVVPFEQLTTDACNTPGGGTNNCELCCDGLSYTDCCPPGTQCYNNGEGSGLQLNPDYLCDACEWWGSCQYAYKGGGKLKRGGNNSNRRNQMRRGGRTRPVARGRGRQMARGGRARPAPRGRAMASGGRTRGRKMPGGGRTCGMPGQPPCGGGYRKGGRTRPAPRGRMARGGRPTPRGRGRTMARGGRARPVARGRGRAMARGGRAPGRRFQVGGGAQCPAGTFRTADGRCTQMGS